MKTPRPTPARLLAGALLLAALAAAALYGPGLLAAERGDRAAAAGEAAAAQGAYREALARTPWMPGAWRAGVYDRLGRSLQAGGDYAAARDAWRAALEAGGPSAERYTGLGRALEQLEDKDGALAQYEAARALDPAGATLPALLAPLYWERREWDKAEIAYGDLLAAAHDLDAPDAARAHYRYALLVYSSAPEVAREHLRLAQGDAQLARRVPALLRALDDAASISDAAARAVRLGAGLAEAREYYLAGGLFQQAIDLNPSYGDAYAYLGFAYDRVGYDGLPFINRAQILAPQSALPHMMAGYHWREREHWMAAREEFAAALKLDAQNAAAAAEIGQMYQREEDFGQAETWLKEAIRMAPGDAGFYALLAQFYFERGVNIADASAAAEHAAALSPDQPLVLEVLGWSRFLSGRMEEAAILLEGALRADPQSPSAAYRLGMLYQARGRRDDARTALQRAQALDPSGFYGKLAEGALAQMR